MRASELPSADKNRAPGGLMQRVSATHPTVILDGVPVHAADQPTVVAQIDQACTTRQRLHIVTLNVHFLTLARRNAAFRGVIEQAQLVVPDGRLLLWMAALAGAPLPSQITGHDLVRACVHLARGRGYRIFLLGGRPGLATALAATLRRDHPELAIAGTDGGTFDGDGSCAEAEALMAQIRQFAPHVLLVALGAPKQELWIAQNLPAAGACVAIGVGGVFDTLMGDLPRAPRWMQVAGLESLFQLFLAPRRYARRYLLEDPPTLLRLLGRALVLRFQQGSR